MHSIIAASLFLASSALAFTPNAYEKSVYTRSGFTNLPANTTLDTFCASLYDVCKSVTSPALAKKGYQVNSYCNTVDRSATGAAEPGIGYAQCEVRDLVLAVTVDFLDLAVAQLNTTLVFPSKSYSHSLPSRRNFNNAKRLVTHHVSKKLKPKFCRHVKASCPQSCDSYYEAEGDFTAKEIASQITSHSRCSINDEGKASWYCWCQSDNYKEFASVDLSLFVGKSWGAYGILPNPVGN